MFKLEDEFYRLYSNELDPYVTLRFAHRLTTKQLLNTPRGRTNFITHHKIQNPNIPGRVRVVCHANERKGELSMNEQLPKWPEYL